MTVDCLNLLRDYYQPLSRVLSDVMCAVCAVNVSIHLKKSLLIRLADTLQILVTNDLVYAAFPVHVLAAPAWLQGLVLNKK